MSLSFETLAAARTYTDDSLAGAGAVAGVPCQIQSITAITGGNRVTFLWTDNNGVDHTSTMDVMNGVDGEDGKGIQSVSVNAENHLIITYTDGTTVDAGQIEIHSAVDSVNGKTGDVTLDAEDVGALPDNTPIPTKTSDLSNDSGFITNADVPTKTSDLTNDSGFITKAVNDLVSYYLKSETYSKTEVDDIVTAIKNSRFEVVATLPTTDIKTNVIYLVPKSPSQTNNVKDEYINLDGTTAGWEKIGDTEIDLSNYVTTQALNTALAAYTTTADLTTLLAAKQDTLTFDDAPTENSNNPVKSNGLYVANQTLTSAFVNNVNENGCKNRCPFDLDKMVEINTAGTWSGNAYTYRGITYTIYDDHVNVNGTCNATNNSGIKFAKNMSIAANTYMLDGGANSSSDCYMLADLYNGSTHTYKKALTSSGVECVIGSSDTIASLEIEVFKNKTINNVDIYPMFCLKSDWDLSHDYVAPSKTNLQLTQDSVTWDDISEVGAVNYLENKSTTQVDATTGLTFTVNDDKSITVSATSGTYPHTVPSAKAFIINSDSCDNLKDEKVYRLSGCPSGGSSSSYYIAFYQSGVVDKSDQGDGYVFAKTASMTSVLTQISIKANTVLSSAITFYPMIAPVDYNGPYVPYAKTNLELTEDRVTWEDQAKLGAVNYCNFDINSGTKKGYTFTNDNGVIHVTGSRATGETGNVDYRKDMTLKAGTYRVSGCPSGGDNTKWRLLLAINNSTQYAIDYGYGAVFTLAADSDDVKVYCTIMADYSDSVDMYYKPMIAPVSYNGPYVPYAPTNKEIGDLLTIKELDNALTAIKDLTFSMNKAIRVGNIVEIDFQFTVNETNTIAGYTNIASMPTGYKPKNTACTFVSFSNPNKAATLTFRSDGNIQNVDSLSNGEIIRGTAIFVCS